MKKFFIVMIAMLMSISMSSFAGTTTSTKSVVNNKSAKMGVPANIIVKQTITFDDGKTIEVFYEKRGEDCKLYSKSDVTKYGFSDIMRIKSSNFEKVDRVEGKCYATRTVKALVAMVKGFLK